MTRCVVCLKPITGKAVRLMDPDRVKYVYRHKGCDAKFMTTKAMAEAEAAKPKAEKPPVMEEPPLEA